MRTEFPSRQVSPSWRAPDRPRPSVLGAVFGFFGLDGGAAQADSQPPALLRFLRGEDESPRPLTPAETAALGDVFSREVLAQGGHPLTLRALDQAIAGIASAPLPLRRMFLVAEGAQIAASGAGFELNARLVFTWQASNNKPPDLLVSTAIAADDPASLLQLVAWSERDRAFHFFERKDGAWFWAGNSFHALSAPTRGQGPFDSHINGALVMKELKEPWSHWHSMDASIGRAVFGPTSPFNTEPLFADLEGAQMLENIVRAGVRRWTKGRIARHLADGQLRELPAYMRQVLWCTSVNLVSSKDGFNSSEPELDLPTSFFFDAEAIEFLAGAIDAAAEILPMTRLHVDAALYRAAVRAKAIGVTEDGTQRRRIAGDTHFAFLVPERAFEDQAVLAELVNVNALGARLGLALLLVDYCNPVFSPARAALLAYVPAAIAAGAEGAALDQALVAAIRAGAGGPGSPEAEFLALWDQSDLLGHAAALLADYHGALVRRLATPEGVADLVDLAESRREAVRATRSLAEFRSTMAKSEAPRAHLAMRPDATIATKTSQAGEGEN
jgi:hypothetical protein